MRVKYTIRCASEEVVTAHLRGRFRLERKWGKNTGKERIVTFLYVFGGKKAAFPPSWLLLPDLLGLHGLLQR